MYQFESADSVELNIAIWRKKICTFGVTVDSKAALRCLEFGDKSGSSTETFLFTGNRGDWKIGVWAEFWCVLSLSGLADPAPAEGCVRTPAGVVDLMALCRPFIVAVKRNIGVNKKLHMREKS